MINARAETVATKPAFKRAFAGRRCIIPADGFYEWTTQPDQKKKQPYFIHRPDGEPYAFAGIWERWKGPKGAAEEGTDAEPLRSCSIITTIGERADGRAARPHAGHPSPRRAGTAGWIPTSTTSTCSGSCSCRRPRS